MHFRARKYPFRTVAFCLAVVFCLLSFPSCTGQMDREDFEDPSDTSGEVIVSPSDTRPKIAISFDDGPNHNADRTKLVVDELCKYGYSATFFVLGNRISGGDSLSYAVEKGMEIGIHGYSHIPYGSSCSAETFHREMKDTLSAIHRQSPDYEVRLMRPVEGTISSSLAGLCPYPIIMWSIDTEDWRYRYNAGDSDEIAVQKVNTIVANALDGLCEGDIILMHEIYESTYDALVILLAKLDEMGYHVVSVSELLGENLQAGQKYYRK